MGVQAFGSFIIIPYNMLINQNEMIEICQRIEIQDYISNLILFTLYSTWFTEDVDNENL